MGVKEIESRPPSPLPGKLRSTDRFTFPLLRALPGWTIIIKVCVPRPIRSVTDRTGDQSKSLTDRAAS